MELSQIIPHIEALIFASDKPLTSLDIVELINNAFGFMEERISLDQIEAAVEGIREKYSAEFYPFEIRESGGGFQFLTKKDFHKTVAQLNGDKFLKRLSTAAMETLAIIAYKQPITKGEVEAIRGVNSDYSIQKLLEKELIVITGRNEELPGKPLVYSTSKSFMDYFGLNSTNDLPKIKEVLAEQTVQGTLINDAINNHGQEEIPEGTNILVGDNGQLILQPVDETAEQSSTEPEISSEQQSESDQAEALVETDGTETPSEESVEVQTEPSIDETSGDKSDTDEVTDDEMPESGEAIPDREGIENSTDEQTDQNTPSA